MSFLRSYLGLAGVPPTEADTAARALPAQWYTYREMYELERRAIFSKKWLLTTHKLRLPESGDWLRYDVAGFDLVVCKDRTGSINAFHNVCRHRAFPIVTKETGHNSVFSCKYHGWSYGLNGKLAKAPQYQDLEGFDRSQNNLLPVHVHIDANGFIWVNLDGKEKPEFAWETDFDIVEQQEKFESYNFEDYIFDQTWEMEGEYNWKILADNHNEGYHCTTPTVETQASDETTPEKLVSDLNAESTYFFPNASTNISPKFFFIQRFVPNGPTKSTVKYEVYRHKESSQEDFDAINAAYKSIMEKNNYLCGEAQKNLNAGVFVNGEMHPSVERGPLVFQQSVRNLMAAHHQREIEAGGEIWPARQQLPKTAKTSDCDVKFCLEVDECSVNKELLAF